MTDDHEHDDPPAVTFGAWLLTQRDAGGLGNSPTPRRSTARSRDPATSTPHGSGCRRTAPVAMTGKRCGMPRPNGWLRRPAEPVVAADAGVSAMAGCWGRGKRYAYPERPSAKPEL